MVTFLPPEDHKQSIGSYPSNQASNKIVGSVSNLKLFLHCLLITLCTFCSLYDYLVSNLILKLLFSTTIRSEQTLNLSRRRKREANSMASGGESHKHHAAEHSYCHRQACQNLLRIFRRNRVEARHNVLIKQRNRRENHYRHECVDEV